MESAKAHQRLTENSVHDIVLEVIKHLSISCVVRTNVIIEINF